MSEYFGQPGKEVNLSECKKQLEELKQTIR